MRLDTVVKIKLGKILTPIKKTPAESICKNYVNANSQKSLQNIYMESAQTYQVIANSVKSRTLQELYRDKFRPSKIKSGMTTVKSIDTGMPEEAYIFGKLTDGFSTKTKHKITFNLFSFENGNLGFKNFGIGKLSKNKKNFIPGYIASFRNNLVAGTQIRLLQAAIENASKQGITQIPLRSLIPSVIYHTKMGFRPIESYTNKLTNFKDIVNILKKNAKTFKRFKFSEDEITPIISCKDGEYYFDLNRTLYCSAMKHNKNILNATKQKHLSIEPDTSYGTIDMVLEGKEYDAWLNRIRGFEITQDGNVPMLKENILYKIQRLFLATLRCLGD